MTCVFNKLYTYLLVSIMHCCICGLTIEMSPHNPFPLLQPQPLLQSSHVQFTDVFLNDLTP